MICKLRKREKTSITAYLVVGKEEKVYKSIGIKRNTEHCVSMIDERPYIDILKKIKSITKC